MNRVGITGMGVRSPIGNDLASVCASLREGTSGVRRMEDWSAKKGLRPRVGAPVTGFDPKSIPRRFRRTMGRMGTLGAAAANDAVAHAGLSAEVLASGRAGVAMGSTTGSPQAMEDFFVEYLGDNCLEQIEGTLFMRLMSHTVAANVAMMLGIRGCLLSPCAACASSTQAIGQGLEEIRRGRQDVMVCGGAEELHPLVAGVFDIVHAASHRYNDRPQCTPRPFDRDRDGLVIGEAGAVVVLEALEHAKRRGATVYGEILGYGTNSSAVHMTQPIAADMVRCMTAACEDARVRPGEIDYVNAHATATQLGDVAEAAAIAEMFGSDVPVSSLKGQTGHTLGACGALEVIACQLMMAEGFLAPTRNLDTVAPECEGIGHLRRLARVRARRIMSSNFAFGGVNASLVVGVPHA